MSAEPARRRTEDATRLARPVSSVVGADVHHPRDPVQRTNSRTAREPYFDGVRGLAILAVVAFHWVSTDVPLFRGGYIGVDVFFVLSGFIITRLLWRRTTTGPLATEYVTFLGNRVRRLYPALLGLLVLGVLGVWIAGGPVPVSTACRSAVLSLLQAGSVVNGAVRGVGMDPFSQTWSLAVEWVFYLVWPILVMRHRRRRASAGGLAAAAGAAAVALYLGSLLTSPYWFYFGPTSRAAQLHAGCALALWTLDATPRPRVPPAVVTGLATASLLALGAWTVFGPSELGPGYRYLGFPVATLAAVVVCAVPMLSPRSPVRALLSIRPRAHLGVASYSLYLRHLLATKLLDKDRIHLPEYLLGGAGVAGTAVLTLLSYRFLERPFLRSRARALEVPSA